MTLLIAAGLNAIPNIGLLLLPCYGGASSYDWYGFPICFFGWRTDHLNIGGLSLIPASINMAAFVVLAYAAMLIITRVKTHWATAGNKSP